MQQLVSFTLQLVMLPTYVYNTSFFNPKSYNLQASKQVTFEHVYLIDFAMINRIWHSKKKGPSSKNK